MTNPDVERYIRAKTGSITEGERQQQIADVIRYRTPDLEPSDFEPTQYARGFFLPPGFMAANITDVTTSVTNRTVARYLGVAPANLAVVTIRMNVTTALVTTTWAEIAIATSLEAVMGAGADLIMEGFTDVAATFNSINIATTEVAVNIARDAHVWALWGSQASIPFVVSAGIGDVINSGFVQFANTTRPSLMANPTTFGVSAVGSQNAWMGINW